MEFFVFSVSFLILGQVAPEYRIYSVWVLFLDLLLPKDYSPILQDMLGKIKVLWPCCMNLFILQPVSEMQEDTSMRL